MSVPGFIRWRNVCRRGWGVGRGSKGVNESGVRHGVSVIRVRTESRKRDDPRGGPREIGDYECFVEDEK